MAVRVAVGFAIGLLFWIGFSAPYETALAAAAERVLRATESPAVTRLESRSGEILVDRRDFPAGAPKPGLPAADLHFNFVLLVALFALDRRPWSGERVAALLVGCGVLAVVHVAALCLQVRSVYAVRLGSWSEAHYGPWARNLWAGAFHFYQIAGRFAAPFAIWWVLRRAPEPIAAESPSRKKKSARGRRAPKDEGAD